MLAQAQITLPAASGFRRCEEGTPIRPGSSPKRTKAEKAKHRFDTALVCQWQSGDVGNKFAHPTNSACGMHRIPADNPPSQALSNHDFAVRLSCGTP